MAVRFSEFESIETVLSLKGKVDWVWVDCFNEFPLTYEKNKKLKKAGFKICLVSPELHGRSLFESGTKLGSYFSEHKMEVDAVCTKEPAFWEKIIDMITKVGKLILLQKEL